MPTPERATEPTTKVKVRTQATGDIRAFRLPSAGTGVSLTSLLARACDSAASTLHVATSPPGTWETKSDGKRFVSCVCNTAVPIVTPQTCHGDQVLSITSCQIASDVCDPVPIILTRWVRTYRALDDGHMKREAYQNDGVKELRGRLRRLCYVIRDDAPRSPNKRSIS